MSRRDNRKSHLRQNSLSSTSAFVTSLRTRSPLLSHRSSPGTCLCCRLVSRNAPAARFCSRARRGFDVKPVFPVQRNLNFAATASCKPAHRQGLRITQIGAWRPEPQRAALPRMLGRSHHQRAILCNRCRLARLGIRNAQWSRTRRCRGSVAGCAPPARACGATLPPCLPKRAASSSADCPKLNRHDGMHSQVVWRAALVRARDRKTSLPPPLPSLRPHRSSLLLDRRSKRVVHLLPGHVDPHGRSARHL